MSDQLRTGLLQKRQANNPTVTSTNPGCPVPENQLPNAVVHTVLHWPSGPPCSGTEYERSSVHATLQATAHSVPNYGAPLSWAAGKDTVSSKPTSC